MSRFHFATYWPVIIFVFALLGGMARGEGGRCTPPGSCRFQRQRPPESPYRPNRNYGNEPAPAAPAQVPPQNDNRDRQNEPSAAHEPSANPPPSAKRPGQTSLSAPSASTQRSKRPEVTTPVDPNADISNSAGGARPVDPNVVKRLLKPGTESKTAAKNPMILLATDSSTTVSKEYCRGNDDRRQLELQRQKELAQRKNKSNANQTGQFTTATHKVEMKATRQGGKISLHVAYNGILRTRGDKYADAAEQFSLVPTDKDGNVNGGTKPLVVTRKAPHEDFDASFGESVNIGPFDLVPGKPIEGFVLVQTAEGDPKYVTTFENRDLNQKVKYTLTMAADKSVTITYDLLQRGDRPEFPMLALTASSDPSDAKKASPKNCFPEKEEDVGEEGEIVGNK